MVLTRKTWIHVLPYWAHRIVSLPVSLLRRLDVVSLLINQQVCLVRSSWFVITQIKLEKLYFPKIASFLLVRCFLVSTSELLTVYSLNY